MKNAAFLMLGLIPAMTLAMQDGKDQKPKIIADRYEVKDICTKGEQTGELADVWQKVGDQMKLYKLAKKQAMLQFAQKHQTVNPNAKRLKF